MQTTGDRATGAGVQGQSGTPGPAQKVRVYEVAKDVGLSNKDLVDKIRALGIEVKNHMSALEPDDVTRVKRALDKERHENTVVERIQPTVIRRRSKGGPEGGVAETPRPAAPSRPAAGADVRRRVALDDILPHRGPKPAPVEPEPEEVEVEEHVEPVVAARPEPVAEKPAPVVEAKPAPVAEAKPAPVVEAKPAPVAEAKPAPVVESKPAPVAETPAPRAETREPAREEPAPTREAPRAAAEASRQAEPERRPAPEPERRPAAESRPVAPVAAAPGTPPAAERPRQKTQFELELERARAEAAAKQAAIAAQKAAEAPPAPVTGRPAVGSIIELPLPRIHITERGPGGRPVGQPGGRAMPPQPVIPGAGQVRGRFAESQRPGAGRKTDTRPGFGKKQVMAPGKKARSTQITTPAEHKRVIKMEESIGVAEIAHQMGIKATELLKKLWSMGMVGVNINQSIDLDTATLLAGEFGYEVQSVAFSETAALAEGAEANPEDLEPRAPVVTIMGHVDHGKTSLLDVIRHADVAAGEAGGITQHIGAYRVSAQDIGDVVFLDTPGHAAFTQMRARGAQATDIVVLVVAADDGVMPQTIEALNHAKDAKVPIIVAATKVDKPQANPDRVKQQLSEHALIPEEWGGDTMYVNVSAYAKTGIDKLLEAIQLQAQILELKANPKKLAKGIVIEAKLDRNRGPMATILVQEGTLHIGDLVVAGEHIGKVRAMLNDKGSPVQEAGPATPVELLGLDGVPEAGDVLNAVADEKNAKTVVEHRRDQRRKKDMASTGKLSLENVLEKIQEGQVKELKIVLKTDVQGSAEALRDALARLSTDAVKVNVIQAGVGGITESDVNLAKAGGAIIIGFHVRSAGKSASLAEQEGVDIKLYDIIYDAIDDVKKAMVGLLAPIRREKALGKAEVREVFQIPKIGAVAGCFVSEGKVNRQAQIRVIRDAVHVYSGKLGSLKRFKDDAREVAAGYECGLTIDGYNDIRVGDILEAYEVVEEAATL